MTDHSHVTGDARKHLEAAEVARNRPWDTPFDMHPACRVPFASGDCGRRDLHTHIAPILAQFPSSDST